MAAARPVPSRSIPSRSAPRARDGFALVETVVALLLIGLMAGLSLPLWRGGPGAAALRATAYRVSALLRADRNAAFTLGRPMTTLIDAPAGLVRPGRGGAALALGPGVRMDLVAPLPGGVRFYADGRASGGTIRLSVAATRLDLRVNSDTGAIDLDVP